MANKTPPATRAAVASSPHQVKRRVLHLLPLSQLLSLLMLAISLTTTYFLWREAQHTTREALEADFDYLVRETNRRLEQRMLTYEQVLRGAVGLFNASGDVNREEFHTYFTALELKKNYPGIQGLGYAVVVPPSSMEEHIQAVRNEGFPEYTIYPEGKRDLYTSILYLEPFTGRNLRAFGYDMFSHPVRRNAMERARDTGETAMSGKVILVQEVGTDVQTGFLMYVPLYRKGAPHDTVQERRANLIGWVYAPFRMRDLVESINTADRNDLHLQIYDGKQIADDALMYRSSKDIGAGPPGKRFVRIQHVRIRHHDWTVVASSPPWFEQRLQNDRAELVLKAGVAMSLLLTLITWLLVDERARAWQAADYAYRLALYDVLTDLPNRKLFNDRLHHAIAQARREQGRVAVMFLDLDRFKPINDTYGHEVGDLLLKEVAKRLCACVRESDTVARLGGDEFVMLFPYSETEHGEIVVAEKILQALTDPFLVSSHTLHISSSIGIAVYPEHGSDERNLLRNADTAMYHAKKNGRKNYQVYQPQMEKSKE